MDLNIKPLDNLTEIAKEFIQRIIIPPIEEVGGLFTDRAKLWRFKNQVTVITKAEEYLQSKGIKTKKVSLKIMAPLLEDCSLEDDEGLQEKWAALLANTVREGDEIPTTLYSHILSQLSHSDAELFELIYNTCSTTNKSGDKVLSVKIPNVALQTRSLIEHYKGGDVSIDNLIRLRLIKELNPSVPYSQTITLTDLGFRFKFTCTWY